MGVQGILTAGTVSKCKGRIAPIAAAGTLPSLLVGTPSRGGTPSVGAGSSGVTLTGQWTGTLGQGARWSEPTPPQVGSGSNPLSRTHFPSGFAWVRGSGFAKQVGSQWVRAKVGFWPCGFAVGSRQSGFAKVGSSGFANVGSRKVGSRGKHQVGSRVGSRKGRFGGERLGGRTSRG